MYTPHALFTIALKWVQMLHFECFAFCHFYSAIFEW